MTDTLTELEKVREALTADYRMRCQIRDVLAFYDGNNGEKLEAIRKRMLNAPHLDSLDSLLATLDTIIAKQKATEEVMEAVRVRLVQIASGDYRACGHLAEAVALDALAKINTILQGKEPTE